MAPRAVHVLIEGRVQGVWFRGWMEQEATALGLSGWVRNRRDGNVEALFAGEGASIDAMLALCWQGPPMAKVTSVTVGDAAAPAESGFRRLPSDH